MKVAPILLALVFSAGLYAAPIENVTSSALMTGDSAVFNLDFIDPFGLPLYDVVLKARNAGNEQSAVMAEADGGIQYATTFQTALQFNDPSGEIEYYGRVVGDTLVATQSFKNASNEFPPESWMYADLASDAVGDTTPGSAGQWLDLTGAAATFSDTRFFAQLSNAGGGWPQSQGFMTYFAYGFVIANPDTMVLSALALIYANIPIILPSGLYRVNLADTSFSRIGNLSSQPSGNYLHLACDIADITSDPLFPTWPPASGHIITGGFSFTVEFGEPGFNDYTYPSSFIPHTQTLAVGSNAPPGLANESFDFIPNISLNVGIDYFDADGNLPVLRQLFFDRGIFEMGAFDHSYGDSARFTNLLNWPGEGYHFYFFRFSDGRDTVQTPWDTMYIDLSPVSENNAPSNSELSQNYPNPFNARTEIAFTLAASATIELTIFDITGKEVAVLAGGRYGAGTHSVTWDGRNSAGQFVSSGVYFYRLSNKDKGSVAKRMLLLK